MLNFCFDRGISVQRIGISMIFLTRYTQGEVTFERFCLFVIHLSPSVSSVRRPLFVGRVVCHGCIVAKRCEIGPRLLLITNRKSHIGFQMT